MSRGVAFEDGIDDSTDCCLMEGVGGGNCLVGGCGLQSGRFHRFNVWADRLRVGFATIKNW